MYIKMSGADTGQTKTPPTKGRRSFLKKLFLNILSLGVDSSRTGLVGR